MGSPTSPLHIEILNDSGSLDTFPVVDIKEAPVSVSNRGLSSRANSNLKPQEIYKRHCPFSVMNCALGPCAWIVPSNISRCRRCSTDKCSPPFVPFGPWKNSHKLIDKHKPIGFHFVFDGIWRCNLAGFTSGGVKGTGIVGKNQRWLLTYTKNGKIILTSGSKRQNTSTSMDLIWRITWLQFSNFPSYWRNWWGDIPTAHIFFPFFQAEFSRGIIGHYKRKRAAVGACWRSIR